MYKTVNFLFALFLSVLLFSSCEKEPILEVSQSSLTFIEQGGTQTISFSTNKDWSASVSGGTGWCTISPASGKSENKTISVTTVANTSYDDRTATITINAEELSKVITIVQPKKGAIILTKDTYEVGTIGGNITVELNSNVEYNVTIPTENQTWITNSTTKGLATSTLTFIIAPNGTYDSRTGKIIIKDKATALADTIHVTQSQKDAIILTQKTVNVADTLIVISVELKSNTSYMVTIPSAAQLWIKQLQTKALKTESLQFEIARNTAFQPRSAEIIIQKPLTTITDKLYINQTKAPNIPSVMTYGPYTLTGSSASLAGSISSDGGGDILAKGICWRKTDNPTIEDSKTSNGKGTGYFTAEVSGLESGTKYYARSYATNRAGTGYGGNITFTTSIIKSTLLTLPATQITKNSAVTGGIITLNGGAITQSGVCWSIYRDPTISSKKTTDGSTSGEFVSAITGLLPATKYYVRAYATNSAGTSYGENVEFSTLIGEPYDYVYQGISLYVDNSIEIICREFIDGGAEVTEKGICWSLNDNPTINDNKTNNGTGTNTFTVKIYNLQPNLTYYFRAYATNSHGTSYGDKISVETYGELITDIDGNIYPTARFGTQTWMAENLRTTKYRNGSNIPTGIDTYVWSHEWNGAYIWYNKDEVAYKNTYGALYNWPAVNTGRLCPTGWHVPSDFEWTTLTTFYSGESVAGGILKDTFLGYWEDSNSRVSRGQSKQFSALPGGRFFYPEFQNIGRGGYWWSSTSYFRNEAISREMFYSRDYVKTNYFSGSAGLSVRCIKD